MYMLVDSWVLLNNIFIGPKAKQSLGLVLVYLVGDYFLRSPARLIDF